PDRVTYPPIVDIVVLSKADTDELRRMAQHTIDTARAGAGEHTVNVVVIEQQPGVRYRDAVSLHEPGEFAYNAFANKGIATGRAPWAMDADRDLEFHDGWLDALLPAKHDGVAPGRPREGRQSRVQRNETGTENGKLFSGWCFMMARSLCETIGGLDEDFRFWCADDSVIEQVKAVGVLPMLVPEAKVTHLISRTVGSRALASDPEDDGSLTWAMVRRFEQKYGVAKFANDQRYKAWKARHAEPHGALAPVPAGPPPSPSSPTRNDWPARSCCVTRFKPTTCPSTTSGAASSGTTRRRWRRWLASPTRLTGWCCLRMTPSRALASAPSWTERSSTHP